MLVASATFSGDKSDAYGMPVEFFSYFLMAGDDGVMIIPIAGDSASAICPVISTTRDALRAVWETLRQRHSTLRASLQFRPERHPA
jgi:hypothetical protein